MRDCDECGTSSPEAATLTWWPEATRGFADYVLEHRSRVFCVVVARYESSGDRLIRLGCEHLLARLEVEVRTEPAAADLLVWPGGLLGPYRTSAVDLARLRRRHPHAKLVIAPCGFPLSSSDLRSRVFAWAAGHADAIFARDPRSLENLRALFSDGRLRLGMAACPSLALRDSEWLKRLRAGSTESYALAAFREDFEGAGSLGAAAEWIAYLGSQRLSRGLLRLAAGTPRRELLERARQASGQGSELVEKDASGCAFEEFVLLVQGASRVYTDRLHTMVLACLLGKPVTAYELRRPKLGPFFDLAMSDWGDVTFVTVQR